MCPQCYNFRMSRFSTADTGDMSPIQDRPTCRTFCPYCGDYFLGEIASHRASDFAYCYPFRRSVVCLSVCRLSHSCTLLKPFDRFTCHLARHLRSSMTYCSRWGFPIPRGRRDLGVEPPDNTCTCLLMIRKGAAPISDFASYRITSAT